MAEWRGLSLLSSSRLVRDVILFSTAFVCEMFFPCASDGCDDLGDYDGTSLFFLSHVSLSALMCRCRSVSQRREGSRHPKMRRVKEMQGSMRNSQSGEEEEKSIWNVKACVFEAASCSSSSEKITSPFHPSCSFLLHQKRTLSLSFLSFSQCVLTVLSVRTENTLPTT